MTPFEIDDVIAEVREAQHRVCVNLLVHLRRPSDAVLARLDAAREKEAALFKTILHVERPRGFQPGHKHSRRGAEAQHQAAEANAET